MRDFNHTVNVLVQAYLNDTLHHDYCTACAVGNMITAGGYKFNSLEFDLNNVSWLLFINKYVRYKPSRQMDEEIALAQIDATGYSPIELSKIEYAFEHCAYVEDENQWIFNGLMAVIDVLAEIHGIDLTQKEQAKKLFVKA